MDLTQQLDDAIGSPAPDRPATLYLQAGRRTRRRRRLAAAGTGAAVVALVGGMALGVPRGGGSPAPVAGDPTLTASASPTPRAAGATVTTGPMSRWAGSQAAGYDVATGELEVRDGWHVTQRINGPINQAWFGEVAPPDRSVALALSDGTRTQWVVADWRRSDTGSAGTTWNLGHQLDGWSSLADYVEFVNAFHTQSPTTQAVAFAADGTTLEPRNGARILEQGAVQLGEETAYAARLELLDQQWWLLARHTADGPTYVPVIYPYEGDPDTLAGFGEHVRELLADGEL
jgi:hypothetical protein